MGLGTLCGAALPLIPLLLFSSVIGIVGTILLAIAVMILVSVVRCQINNRSLRWNLATSTIGLLLGVSVGLAAGA